MLQTLFLLLLSSTLSTMVSNGCLEATHSYSNINHRCSLICVNAINKSNRINRKDQNTFELHNLSDEAPFHVCMGLWVSRVFSSSLLGHRSATHRRVASHARKNPCPAAHNQKDVGDLVPHHYILYFYHIAYHRHC